MDRAYCRELARELRSELRFVNDALLSLERLKRTTLLDKTIAELRYELKQVNHAIAALQPHRGSRSKLKRIAKTPHVGRGRTRVSKLADGIDSGR